MAVCTFFGHRDTPTEIESDLEKILIDLIENKNVDKFYVGCQGKFDYLVRKKLIKMKKKYPNIDYSVVLAYLPKKNEYNTMYEENETVYPEGLELIHPKYAIYKRNLWMIDQSDYVVSFVVHEGGAANFKRVAEKKGLIVFNIAKTKK